MVAVTEKRLKPSEIRFTQNSIAAEFKDGRRLVETFSDVKNNITRPNEIKQICVAEKDGKYFTLNNRRLYVFRALEFEGVLKQIRVKMIPFQRILLCHNITSQNDGNSVKIRGQGIALPHSIDDIQNKRLNEKDSTRRKRRVQDCSRQTRIAKKTVSKDLGTPQMSPVLKSNPNQSSVRTNFSPMGPSCSPTQTARHVQSGSFPRTTTSNRENVHPSSCYSQTCDGRYAAGAYETNHLFNREEAPIRSQWLYEERERELLEDYRRRQNARRAPESDNSSSGIWRTIAMGALTIAGLVIFKTKII